MLLLAATFVAGFVAGFVVRQRCQRRPPSTRPADLPEQGDDAPPALEPTTSSDESEKRARFPSDPPGRLSLPERVLRRAARGRVSTPGQVRGRYKKAFQDQAGIDSDAGERGSEAPSTP